MSDPKPKPTRVVVTGAELPALLRSARHLTQRGMPVRTDRPAPAEVAADLDAKLAKARAK